MNIVPKSSKPFQMPRWGYVVGIIFVIISMYMLSVKGNVPSILATESGGVGEFTILGMIVFAVVFPSAVLGLTIEGLIPTILFVTIVLFVEFIYGFLVAWAAHLTTRKIIA